MPDLLAFPFRLGLNGSVVTIPDDEDTYLGAELGVLISTVPGERVLCPQYGMEDPTFDQFAEATLKAQIERYGPPVEIVDVQTTTTETGSSITVSFKLVDEETPDEDFALGG
jgi:hypothetical protein